MELNILGNGKNRFALRIKESLLVKEDLVYTSAADIYPKFMRESIVSE